MDHGPLDHGRDGPFIIVFAYAKNIFQHEWSIHFIPVVQPGLNGLVLDPRWDLIGPC
jgi:hypothetical protein